MNSNDVEARFTLGIWYASLEILDRSSINYNALNDSSDDDKDSLGSSQWLEDDLSGSPSDLIVAKSLLARESPGRQKSLIGIQVV